MLLMIFDSEVAGDNIPVAPVFNPSPVVGTTKVAEAKAAFFAAFET